MQTYLSEADHRILELLYYYGLAWQKDIERFLGLSNSHVHERLQHLLNERYVHRRKLSGGRRTETYCLADCGFLYMKEEYDYPDQYIENYDKRLEKLSDGFIKHECLITHTASKFRGAVVHDRRSVLSYLPGDAKQARGRDKILHMEIKSEDESHRADDILYIKQGSQRPIVLFIEVDRGTESARDRHGRPRGKVSKMFEFYIGAYREKYYRRYFGKEVKPYVLFLISTPWNGATRKQNFVDLWKEVGKGSAEKLPIFTTLEEFDRIDPFTLL